MIRRPDLRLVPAAAAVWLVTLLGLHVGSVPAVVAALGVVGAVPLVRPLSRRGPGARAVLVVLLLAGVTATGIAFRVHDVEAHPLRHAADAGEPVTVRVELTAAPTPLRGAAFGGRRAQDRSLARAEVVTTEVGGRQYRSGGSVVLLVPTESWGRLTAGQRVTVRGEAAPPRDGRLVVAVVPVYRAPSEVAPPPEWQRLATDMRSGLRAVAAQRLGPEAAGLLPGLVVGDTTGLPPEVEQEFDAAGLTHLTAVSGANLAIVCGAVLVLLHLLGLGPVVCASGAAVALVGFVGLAGPEPSVLRAAAMGAITLLALVLGRRRSALPALAASVIVLLLLLPELATSAGFALSVAATAGLVLLAPAWAAALRTRGVPLGLAEAIAVPVAAHVVTAPLIAAISGGVSLVAIPANMLAAPVIAPATVFGVLATVTGPVSSWVAGLLVTLAGPELEWVLLVADRASAVPGAVVDWPTGTGGGLLLAVLVLVGLIALRGRRIRLLAVVAVLISALIVLPVRTMLPGWPVQGWSVVACDVGQGDGLVLATGTPGEAVVVDTGPDPRRAANCLRRLGIHRVPLVVLTHLHADHVSGLRTVLGEIPVGAVGIGPLREPRWAYDDLSRDTRARRTPVIALGSGQRLAWPGLVLDVLAPDPRVTRTQDADDANDASLVIRASTPAGRVLLTGDVELAGQGRLVSSGVDLRADVLKVPHHGSRYTTPDFLGAVRPRLALISVGAGNDYGHPNRFVVEALTRAGARVLRTDQEGDIAVLPGPQGPRSASRGDPLRATDD
ncbi:DNA internalization-related competence protein ComEC/Rec2 [Saccharopolyspora rhizosphaerae]|uniref:DNA internalization-related competence protein ComEC/Rec2 n=1 Tax=Saccharopolyspora rhizosphaerae TaxID=2492662 RepID=A0A426K1L4_9PSEU|nr:DNA internalization-related competence protein ComEC/Rec2 [Saccharopolyspora rhizosphaerae]RRO19325.1 DNA internalization-related competence protein ComEC/Rec2 [Saccharopolyspora rhizosphaerae]